MIVPHPNLLAVGGVTRDMCACIVRLDYTGAHIHALGWTTPQRLFFLHHLRRGRCLKFSLTRQILLTLSFETFWSFIVCIKFSAIYVYFFIIYSFLFSKNHISNDYFHTAHIFNFISAIYYWIYLKLWWIALNDLVDDTFSYRRAANS